METPRTGPRATRGVMFDLDGTLADTLQDLANAANHAIALHGRPPHPLTAYRHFVGQGVENLFRAALDTEDDALIMPCVERFKAHLAAHQYDHSSPYDGVPELLDALVQRGVKIAVMSNKPDERTVEMVDTLFGRWRWDAVRGHRAGYAVKPDPTAALEIARELDVPPDAWAYVGDTRADMLTGTAAGFFTVGVTWGFRDEDELRTSGAHAIIHHPSELPGLL